MRRHRVLGGAARALDDPVRTPHVAVLTVLGPGCGVGAVLDENSCKHHMTPMRRMMQRCQPVVGLSCRVSTVLEEELSQLHMTPTRCTMQRCLLVISSSYHISALREEKLCDLRMTPTGRPM